MKLKRLLAFCLILALVALTSGCTQAPPENFPEAGSQTIRQGDNLSTPTPTPSPTPTITPADYYDTDEDLGYDPLAEEDDDDYYAAGVYNELGQSVYSGTTPIPIDPVDMPTPTPRPELEFTYAAVNNSRLGMTYEVPTDWNVTQDENAVYVITDPTMRDNVNAALSISVAPVANNYRLTDVRNDLNTTLNAIQMNYIEWSVQTASARTLMEADGYYNTYRGVTVDGTIVRGLVHVALLDGRTVTVHLIAPGWFNSSYTKVYTRLRNTLKAL